ncbi:hypothetical protein C7T35_37845 [Variovorax sp. WS11]|nr:hypothetical protein C7T35_37845 [Variovorax sp. WS11]
MGNFGLVNARGTGLDRRFGANGPRMRRSVPSWRSARTSSSRGAQMKVQHSWHFSKSPMAFYWKVVAVYAGHISQLLR